MTSPQPPSAGDSADSLEDMRDRLKEQLLLLQQDDLEELLASVHQVSQLLSRITPLQLPQESSPVLAEIRELHGRLALSVAQRMEDASDHLRKIHKGRGQLRAYRQGT